MKKEDIIRYSKASFAAFLTALTIFGTSCTVGPNTETNATTKITQTTETTQTTQETIKEVTEEDLADKTLEELWEEYREMERTVVLERELLEKLRSELSKEKYELHNANVRYDYLMARGDQNDNDVKKEIKELKEKIPALEKSIAEKEENYRYHTQYEYTLEDNLQTYYAVIQQKQLEEYQKGK